MIPCRWCAREIVGLARGALGGWWKHTATNREACDHGGTIAEPEPA